VKSWFSIFHECWSGVYTVSWGLPETTGGIKCWFYFYHHRLQSLIAYTRCEYSDNFTVRK